MNRRQLLGTIGITTAALLTRLPGAFGAERDGTEFTLETQIASNHGHELTLTLTQVITLLRAAHTTGLAQAEIQGASGHSHTATFTVLSLFSLLITGNLELVSGETFGHSHALHLKLGAPAGG